MQILKLLFVFILLLGIQSYPQNEIDSLSTKNEEEFFGDQDDWLDFNWEGDKLFLRGSPSISLGFGQSQVNHKNLRSSFTKPNLLELKLGYTNIRPSKYSEDILKYKFNHIFLSNFFTKSKGVNSLSNDVRTDMWRFGFGNASGYGYDLGSSAIIPYHSTSLSWSRVKFKDTLTSLDDAQIAERYNESFRFGTGAEAGIKFKIVPLVSLDVSYERTIIFERHLFWKWAGSGIIEAASQGMLDHFIGKIGKSSPMALPIVSVILKSALSYGIYELRQEKMNWPFSSAAPLSYDQWKVGVTFNF